MDQTTRTCPRCGLVSPVGATICDCGFSFVTGTTVPPRPSGASSTGPKSASSSPVDNSRLMRWTLYLVAFSALVFLADEAKQIAAHLTAGVAAAAKGQDLELASMAATSVEQASVTLTNTHGFTAEPKCFAPVVMNSQSGEKVTGAVVCSGELKPKSTVTLSAPYSPGAVLRICGREERFGRTVDWSQCSFTLDPR